MSQITDFNKCTDEELIEALRCGNQDVMDYLLNKYKSLVRVRANTLFLMGGDTEDLIQEGMIGLFKAIRDYDPDKNAGFATFAQCCINNQLHTALEASQRKKHQPLNTAVSFSTEVNDEGYRLEDILTREDDNPELRILEQEKLDEFTGTLESALSDMETSVLQMYLQGHNYLEIADALDKSPKSIDNCLQRIRQKVRGILRNSEEEALETDKGIEKKRKNTEESKREKEGERMEFSRLGDHKMRCIIAEQEIIDMGYSMEEILKNGAETQRFMDQIFAMAESKLDMEFISGVKAVRADFLPNHTLSLTFSTISQENMLDQLKELLGNVVGAASDISLEELSRLAKDAGERIAQANSEENQAEAQTPEKNRDENSELDTLISWPIAGQLYRVAAVFDDFDRVLKFADGISRILQKQDAVNHLLKFQEHYYLIIDETKMTHADALRIAIQAAEYAEELVTDTTKCAYVEEHGTVILKKDAISRLVSLL